jgi:hypothetical protein
MMRFGSARVSPHGVTPEILLALLLVRDLWAHAGFDLVITSLTDGIHTKQSLHDDGLAVDLRSHHLPVAAKSVLLAQMRDGLPPYYEVYLEDAEQPNEHFHIEYDWKGLNGGITR